MYQEHSFDELCPYVREVGLQRRDSWRQIPRKIYDHQIFYCFTGTANIIIGDRYHVLSAGDLAIIPPNTPHVFWVEDYVSGELYWCHLDFFYYPDRAWHYQFYNNMEQYVTLFESELRYREHLREHPVFTGGWRLPEVIRIKNADAVEYLFRMLYKDFTRGDDHWQISARIHFLEIFDILLKQTTNERADNSSRGYIVKQIKNFIAQNYFNKIDIPEICSCTGLNHEYASKLFKQETGTKLVEYINQYRIEKAKKLLIESDLSITDIADMVGFANKNYFCTVTKKLTGCTPAALRASLLNLILDPASPDEPPNGMQKKSSLPRNV